MCCDSYVRLGGITAEELLQERAATGGTLAKIALFLYLTDYG